MGSFFGIFKTPSRPKRPIPMEEIKPRPEEVVEGNLNPSLIASNVNPIGMSYWRNIDNHKDSSHLEVLLSVNDELVVFSIDKRTLAVKGHRALGLNHTGEGCYFSALSPNILFVPINNELLAINTLTGERTVRWQSDNFLWQVHSSYHEHIHSATIRNSNYKSIGWVVYNEATKEETVFGLKGQPDECQIDKSGIWLLIKEDNDNRIINLITRQETIITNSNGALGHSDIGFECALGENDYSNLPGALDLINFNGMVHTNLYSTGIWNMGYVSFTNAIPGPIRSQFCLVSTPSDLIKVKLNGSGEGTVVCPNLTESQDYNHRPKANLCPLGQFATWTSFVSGSLNAYIVRIP